MTPDKFAETLLEKTADLLSAPGAWIQGAHALAADREYNVPPSSHEAACWCALGAYIRVKAITSAPDMATRTDGRGIANNAIDAELAARRTSHKGSMHLTIWNDVHGRTQAEVVQLFRDAAARVRKGGV